MTYKDDEIVHHTINQVHIQVAIGSILGDGYLTVLQKRGFSRLWLKYDDRSFAYLQWLRKKLKSFGVGPIKKKRGYTQHYFLTEASELLGALQKIFYPDGHKKCIPENIEEFVLHPIALAIWYMDDGNFDWRLKYHRSPTIATYCFAFDDCVRLTEMLYKNFGIKARVHKSTMRDRVYYRLYIESNSVNKFFDTIKPFVHPCFLYKIREDRQQPR